MSFRESLALAELPVVTFYQGDTKLNFLLDTGANLGILDQNIMSKVEAEGTSRISQITGIGASVSKIPIKSVTFQYKNNSFTDDFQILDMSNTFSSIKKSTGVSVHGILGTHFMQKYKYVLDFKEMIAYSKK